MPKISYVSKKFGKEALQMIATCDRIIAGYQSQGYALTLRQLYYQCVSRNLIANNLQSYKRLGSIINDARLAGLIDWSAIEDRTRNLHKLPDWASPGQIVSACANQFRIDKWKNQPCRIEVWIEKEALAGVFQRVCDELQVPFFSCRGYTSQSEMWVASQRLKMIGDGGQQAIILHFGDHDPSGMDMTRDITDRLALFGAKIELNRLALNMDQVEQYSPPPNPAKITDSRSDVYIQMYGDESWELDALEPDALAALVRDFVRERQVASAWQESLTEEAEHRRLLTQASRNWEEIIEGL